MSDDKKLETIIQFLDNEYLLRELYEATKNTAQADMWLSKAFSGYAEQPDEDCECLTLGERNGWGSGY